MNPREAYGTHPEYIGATLGLLGEDAIRLSYDEHREFAATSLNRFPAVGSVRLDWSGADVLDRRDSFDGPTLAALLTAHAGPDELVIVFWDNLLPPSIALPAPLAARHAAAILDEAPTCWLLLTDSGILIEFQDGEGFTTGGPPAAVTARTT